MPYLQISKDWDDLALERLETFNQKIDLSYEKVLKPSIISCLKECDLTNVLDVGCGVGSLTKEVASIAEKVTGIDVSRISVYTAQEHNSSDNIEYVIMNVESLDMESVYTAVMSNMVLMDLPNIKAALSAIYNSMVDNSFFVFTITHPSFWPIYWSYCDEEDFKYKSEVEIERDFRIGNKIYDGKKTRHFHRPLEYYINWILHIGFKIISITELDGYNENLWYPRFMLFKIQK